MKLRVACLFAAALMISVPSAFSQDIYDNGPTDGNTDAWSLNFGFSVSDSFAIGGGPTGIGGLNFAAWVDPGDVLLTAEVSITSSEFGGTTYFDQVVPFTQTGCVTNQYDFNICTESTAFNGPVLNSGTYWLTLSNAITTNGYNFYWDQNSGPSSASLSSVGTIPSESFTLLGSEGTSSGTSSTPEPATLMLLGSGLLGTIGCVRRKLF